jgi:triacylglycerol lipase
MDEDRQPPGHDGTPWYAVGVSALNGVVGDYLKDRRNGLAITMACYHRGEPLALTPAGLHRAHARLTPKICVLVHGLGCNEGVWRFSDETQPAQGISYGSLLQRELGYTPFYVRYNTGVRISESGRSLAALLDELWACYGTPIDEIALIGHSMGGLVLRSACHYGVLRRSAWIQPVKRVFYLGTPHHGAPLEQVGNVVTSALGAVNHPITRIIRDILNLRSRGVKDLRFGNLVDDDWQGHDPDALMQNNRTVVPWLESADHYLIAGTLTQDPNHVVAQLLGDMLVSLTSAHGQAAADPHGAAVPAAYMKLIPGVHHIGLARHPAVYQQIKAWCSPEL